MPLDSFITPQPPPNSDPNTPAVWDLVRQDIDARDEAGRVKYGTPLIADNGRDPLIDLYQELLDALVYTRQELWKRYGR